MSYAPIPFERTLNDRASSLYDNHSGTSARTSQRVIPSPRKRAPGKNGAAVRADEDYPLIVHCHLLWDWVWQRPQQFISRLSHRHKTLFIETLPPDPALATPLARFRKPPEFPNLTLLSLQFPCWRWPDGAYVDRERRRLVKEFLSGPGWGQFDNPVQWFYDPMAVRAFRGRLGEILTVYDCMDELSKFRGAPPEILERERELLQHANVVFTGGRKLYEAKSRFNDNCHFFGCGVDGQHFGKARSATTEIPPALGAIARPILGYFGVVDERLDYDLLARLADANPQWSIVMVGPVMKVDPEQLPRRANLHWLGQQPYAELPAFCRGFDVCLMPFALNEATEFINPTKALEYMATGRPIISTAVADVVRNFSAVVDVAANSREFIRLCRQALAQPNEDRVQRGLTMAQENSWESIVAKMETQILNAIRSRQVVN